MADILVYCENRTHGCEKEGDPEMVADHQEKCQYRVIPCPSRHRGLCPWVGSLQGFMAHAKQFQCIQIIKPKTDRENELLSSWIGDFSVAGATVFDRTQDTHWQPVLLISKHIVRFLVYLTIHRTAFGHWVFIPRSFSPAQWLNRFSVRWNVYSPTGEVKNNYIYDGKVNSHKLTKQEVLEAGRYLILTDAQIKAIKEGPILFNYTVSLDIDGISHRIGEPRRPHRKPPPPPPPAPPAPPVEPMEA